MVYYSTVSTECRLKTTTGRPCTARGWASMEIHTSKKGELTCTPAYSLYQCFGTPTSRPTHSGSLRLSRKVAELALSKLTVPVQSPDETHPPLCTERHQPGRCQICCHVCHWPPSGAQGEVHQQPLRGIFDWCDIVGFTCGWTYISC